MSRMEEIPKNRLADDFGDDSLDLVERVMQLEEELDINIPDEDAAKIHTVQDALRYLKERRNGGPAA